MSWLNGLSKGDKDDDILPFNNREVIKSINTGSRDNFKPSGRPKSRPHFSEVNVIEDKTKQKVVAMYDFDGIDDEELTIREGDILTLEKDDGSYVDFSGTVNASGKLDSGVRKKAVYEGDKKNGKRHGEGVLTFGNGDKYEGEFKNGEMTGRGKMFWKNGGKYEGGFQNGKCVGSGTHTYANGNVFVGVWDKTGRKGMGTVYYNNGDRFEGNYVNDVAIGKGSFFFKNGDIHSGQYKKGKQDGKGVMSYNNGDEYTGVWRRGKMHGKGTMKLSDGKLFEYTYKDGKIVETKDLETKEKKGWGKKVNIGTPGAIKSAIALYEFEGMDGEELSVKCGERIDVIKDEGEWLMCRNGRGEEGYVPTSYLEL